MNTSSVAKIYEQSLRELAIHQKVNNIGEELKKLIKTINEHPLLAKLLFLEVFSPTEKKEVLLAIFNRLSFSKLMKNFILYLIEERRVDFLPLIYNEFLIEENLQKGFATGSIEGTEDKISKEDTQLLEIFIENRLQLKTQLVYKHNSDIVGGYRIIVGDFLVDATIDYQLDQFKKYCQSN